MLTFKKGRAMAVAALRKISAFEKAETARANVYPPKPTKGPVNYDELERSLMKRFSKTLAELAK